MAQKKSMSKRTKKKSQHKPKPKHQQVGRGLNPTSKHNPCTRKPRENQLQYYLRLKNSYLSDPALDRYIKLWENNMNDSIILYRTINFLGGKGFSDKGPLFTWLYAENPKHKGTENHQRTAIAFYNIKSPFYNVDGEASAQSLVHALVIPKQRIYNAVSLLPQDIPILQEMVAFGYQYITQTWKKTARKWLTTQEYPGQQKEFPHLKLIYEALRNSNFNITGFIRYTYHIHPCNSIGHLHLHVWLDGPFKTLNGRRIEPKNIDSQTIIDYLRR